MNLLFIFDDNISKEFSGTGGLSLVALVIKNLLAKSGDIKEVGSIPVLGRSPEEGKATHSSIVAWRIPWTEEPGGQQSIGLQRVRHD